MIVEVRFGLVHMCARASGMRVVVQQLSGIPNLLCSTMVDIIVVDVARVRLIQYNLWLYSGRGHAAITNMNMLEGGAAADGSVKDTIICCMSRRSIQGLCAASTLR
jgi:hypothetical protein